MYGDEIADHNEDSHDLPVFKFINPFFIHICFLNSKILMNKIVHAACRITAGAGIGIEDILYYIINKLAT